MKIVNVDGMLRLLGGDRDQREVLPEVDPSVAFIQGWAVGSQAPARGSGQPRVTRCPPRWKACPPVHRSRMWTARDSLDCPCPAIARRCRAKCLFSDGRWSVGRAHSAGGPLWKIFKSNSPPRGRWAEVAQRESTGLKAFGQGSDIRLSRVRFSPSALHSSVGSPR